MNPADRIRRAGLRVRLLATTALASVVALVIAYGVFASVGHRHEYVKQLNEDRAIAQVLASEVRVGLPTGARDALDRLMRLESMHATVTSGATHLTLGAAPPTSGRLVHVVLALPNGSVTVTSTVDGLPDSPYLVVLLVTGSLVLVLGATLVTNLVLGRQARRQIAAAVEAAQRISAGDFTARVGSGGPEPLRSLAHAFDDMAARLESAERRQRDLLADLAHEIATPIQALSGYAHAVIDGRIPAEEASVAIDSQTARLSTMLDELAELRLLDEESRPATQAVALRALVEGILTDLAPMAGGLTVRTHLEEVTLASDPELIATVVRNFLTNAFHYTPPGGQVVVTSRRRSQHAYLSVRDTGPGIAEEDQSRVFDRFYRVEPSRDRLHGGTGLGLAIAHRAATRLGGWIELHSELGHGAEFRLVLPLADPPTSD